LGYFLLASSLFRPTVLSKILGFTLPTFYVIIFVVNIKSIPSGSICQQIE
jgi:hypothetical protein